MTTAERLEWFKEKRKSCSKEPSLEKSFVKGAIFALEQEMKAQKGRAS